MYICVCVCKCVCVYASSIVYVYACLLRLFARTCILSDNSFSL